VAAILDAACRTWFSWLRAYIGYLPAPLLFPAGAALIVFSFVSRLARPEGRRVKTIATCALLAGALSLGAALAAALNAGTLPLGSFELTARNINSPREVPIPQALESVALKVSGDREPGFSLELERRSPGNRTIERLAIEGLAEDAAIRASKYYFLRRGEFTVQGPFGAGDTLRIHTANTASFVEGTIKLEFEGSKSHGEKQ
jgi:hypothetical protein